MTITTMGSAEAGELRNRLATCNLADLGGKSWFLHRLQRETGWSRDFATGAITEYLRFCELFALGDGAPVSPGPVIDQVWHLHLLETRHYWRRFCPLVLGRELHHLPAQSPDEPRQGGPSAATVLTRTRQRYTELFGHGPPPQYWPDWCPGTRTDTACRGRPWQGANTRWSLLVLLPADALAAALPRAPADLDFGGLAGWLLVLLLGIATFCCRQRLREPGRPFNAAAIDPVALGFTASGRWRAFDVACAELLVAGRLEMDTKSGLFRATGSRSEPPNVSPWALTLWQDLARNGPSPLSGMERALHDCWCELERRLRHDGILHSASAESRRHWLRVPWILWILFLLPHLFARHFAIGTVLLSLVSILLCVALGSRLGATDRARQQIRRLRAHEALYGTSSNASLPQGVALHSVRSEAAHPLLADYVRLRRQQLARREEGVSVMVEAGCTDWLACSSGGGSSDGGDGGCGGGCGGD